ncbi:RNAse E [Martelella mediterranea]|uniref:Ribonuclease E n=1 Tax=Martelella mediterranea TaxID=293089 RepID=A0A4R3NXE0_9HYPH|nr:ribonuclease E/G [Martelella mediterranea]TCT43131.1 RNAse E [Martelella mediterranea]
MADKMLVDASHEEETRVVVVRGNRIEEFDFESQHKKQLRGNIYLAKVTRVEPSLQAAFVDYGGNRHGFLAFSEIHPDYYQIPLADREALMRELSGEDDDAQSAETSETSESNGDDSKPKPRTRRGRAKSRAKKETVEAADENATQLEEQSDGPEEAAVKAEAEETASEAPAEEETKPARKPRARRRKKADPEAEANKAGAAEADESDAKTKAGEDGEAPGDEDQNGPSHMEAKVDSDTISEDIDSDDEDDVESVGAEDAMEEVPESAHRRMRKQYRIQEVIKRRQIILVQVAKEERGNKGAALTTYLSLAGRYSVLMPNTARGGGISRKITNPADRKRLKEVAKGLDVPQGMGVILRTAGANRTKAEVKRDFEYLMRLWENVRTKTLTSTAPCLVYEEGSLIKRSIRDLYNRDIDEIIVSGDEGYREAKDFMKMLMPSHAKVVQRYRDPHPIFSRSGIEAQLDRMLQPQVTLKSGGYLIINQTEALVAIDVNSGRSTREHSIEDTALQTNLEAAEEVARQLRLRDLAGLVVIDFIDMEEKRNNRAVEKKLKECLKNDRARIQVGRISHFGLLEMSRQRIRASVLESTTQTCPHCGGTGHVLSQSSVALHVLRSVEEYLLKNTTHNIRVRTSPETALYVLNQKRSSIVDYENRFGVDITIEADNTLESVHLEIDRCEPVENPVKIESLFDFRDEPEEIDITPVETETDSSNDDDQSSPSGDEGGKSRRKRRKRRRGNRNNQNGNGDGNQNQSSENNDGDDESNDDQAASAENGDGQQDDQPRRKRRRGKRGGRRNKNDSNGQQQEDTPAQNNDETGSENAPSTPVVASDTEKTTESAAESNVSESIKEDTATSEEKSETEATVTAQGQETAPEPTEKPKRRRRKPAATKVKEYASADEASTQPPAEVTSEDEAMAEIEGRKPRRRTRKAKPAETEAPTAEAPEQKQEPVAPETETTAATGFSEPDQVQTEAPVSESNADSENVSVAAETTADQDASVETDDNQARANRASNVTSSEPVVTSNGNGDEDDRPAKPKRGWWQRRGFL